MMNGPEIRLHVPSFIIGVIAGVLLVIVAFVVVMVVSIVTAKPAAAAVTPATTATPATQLFYRLPFVSQHWPPEPVLSNCDSEVNPTCN